MNPQPKRRGFSVHVFLPNGDPDGVKVVEKDNWTGRGLVIPRVMFADTRSREELNRTGVYLLIGPSDESTLPMLYVGEGDPVKARLDQHASKKDFWTHAVVFTSKDQNLNKAHVQHLESRLVELASTAKRTVLDNGNQPAPPSLSEADIAEVEGYLDDMLLCLPILGYGFFESAPSPTGKRVELSLRGKGLPARGFETAEGFVVVKGSQSPAVEVPSTPQSIVTMRSELRKNGVLAVQGDHLVFTQDYVFGSPSTAAAVCMARNANGRVEWKDAQGRSLRDMQDQVAQEPPA